MCIKSFKRYVHKKSLNKYVYVYMYYSCSCYFSKNTIYILKYMCRRAVGIVRLKQPENLGPGIFLKLHEKNSRQFQFK